MRRLHKAALLLTHPEDSESLCFKKKKKKKKGRPQKDGRPPGFSKASEKEKNSGADR